MKAKLLLLTIAAVLLLSGCGSSQPAEKPTTTAKLTQLDRKTTEAVIIDKLPEDVLRYIDSTELGPTIYLDETEGLIEAKVYVLVEYSLPMVADKVWPLLREYAQGLDHSFKISVTCILNDENVVTWSRKNNSLQGLYVNTKDGTTENISLEKLYEKYNNFGKED